MMAATGDDMGGFKGLKGDVELSSHQDLQQVGGDFGGTKIDFVDSKDGKGNVSDDVGGSYVFVGGVNGCDGPVGDGVDLKDGGDVEVENGGVVVGIGGDDNGLVAGTDKGVVLHGGLVVETGGVGVVEDGKADCEVEVEDHDGLKGESGVGVENGEVEIVEDHDGLKGESGAGVENGEVEVVEDHDGLKGESGVGVENGLVEVVAGDGGNDCEVKVEDQGGLKDESVVGVENGKVFVGDGGNDQDYVVEKNDCGLLVVKEKDVALHGEVLVETGTIGVVEDGQPEDQVDSESAAKLIENQVSRTDTDTDEELGERQEKVIEIMLARESTENSFKSVEQNVLTPSADLGENKKSEAVVLGAGGSELVKVDGQIEVDLGEGQLRKTEIKFVEESSEPQISVTSSIDCVPHELIKDQAMLKEIKDFPDDAELGESKEMVVKIAEAGELSEISVIVQQDVIDSPTDIGQKSDSVVLDADVYELAKFEAGIEVGAVNGKHEEQNELELVEDNENIIAGTADGAMVESDLSGCVIFDKNDTVNLANLKSDKSQMSAELSEHVPTEICGSFLTTIDAGRVSDQGPEDADYRVGLVQGCKVEGVVQVANGDGTKTSETATLQKNLEERIDGCTNSPVLNGTSDGDQCNRMVIQDQSDESVQSDYNDGVVELEVGNMACPVTENKSELETRNLELEDVESGLFSATTGTKQEMEGSNRLSGHHPNDEVSEMKIEFGTFDSAELLPKSGGMDVLPNSQISNGDIESSWKANSTINSIGSESLTDINSKSGIQYHSDMPAKEATVAEYEVPNGSVNDGSAPLLECSIGNSAKGQTLGVVAKAKPFPYLVKCPRFDDNKLREQIKDAQLLVEEKTTQRDDIRSEIVKNRAKLQLINDRYEAKKSAERAARRSVKAKRQDIDSLQDELNRVKNSISVKDITNRISHMEHMIEHETIQLKEEKQLIREVNTLKKLRDQISSNVCSENEVSWAYSQVDTLEMQLKALKKELGDLKVAVSNAEAFVKLLEKEYYGQSEKLKELQVQFTTANDVRQGAYKNFQSLKKQLHEKDKHYWMYKDEAKAANDYALTGDKEGVYRLCANQVKNFMELWNKNDEFREDYVRCNMRSTLRRLKTLDGRSLGPDEEAPVIPIYVAEREDMHLSTPSRKTFLLPATNVKQENSKKPVKSEHVDGESWVGAEPKKKMLKDKTFVKPILGAESVLHVSGHLESVETKEEEKQQQTMEELELAKKAELEQEEIAAKLKEKIRQEERAKAQEALERKKRNAEKAQMRAALRAQKEAEQKEKEREKRLRKKEKKNGDGETAVELKTDSVKEETTDIPGTKHKKATQCNKYSKPKAAAIPPALLNRGKRQFFKQLMWWIFGIVVVLFVLMVISGDGGGGNRNGKPRTKGDRFPDNHWKPI